MVIHLRIIGNKAMSMASIILGRRPVTIPSITGGILKINFKK
jgi:hypothetical protein